jgi:carbon-monoxide dehydrogenase medium subunit
VYWEKYKVMKGVEEALDYLERSQGRAQVIAGGTDLVVQLLEKEPEDRLTLLDISSISEIRGIEIAEDGKWILVGAATTMAELADSKIITNYGRTLALGASWMGAPQIRNVATIGGNVVNAQPAADGTIPLLALGAEAKIVSAQEEKWIALEELFLEIGQSVVNPTKEILTQFRFQPTGEWSSSSLQRLAKRKAFSLPTLLVAARVALDREKRFFEQVRIAVSPVARTPWRAKDAEDSLSGVQVTYVAVEKAAAQAKLGAHPRNSLRGGAEYRKEMVEVLVKRALMECLNSLGVSIHE